jgi:hypothetical protein
MPAIPPADLYEQDFYAWTQAQARELRRLKATRPNLPLDLPHLALEIADLGKDRRDSLRSWTVRVLEHLLLLQYSPARDPRRGWIAEVVDFRRDIARRLTRTLRRDLQRQLPALYKDALDRVKAGFKELRARHPETADELRKSLWETGG